MDSAREIENLVYRYAELIDSGDLRAWSGLFEHADYCGQDGSVLAHGAEAVYQLQSGYLRIYPDTGTPKTKHVTTNVTIEVDEAAGVANSRSYFTIMQATEELPLQCVCAGRYSDVFEKYAGHWRFKSRQIILDLLGDLSRHLLKFEGVDSSKTR